MKPAAFDYVSATSVQAALSAINGSTGRVKILAGGQSLMPMLSQREMRVDKLIDINNVSELKLIRQEGQRIHIGSMVRQNELVNHPVINNQLSIVSAVMGSVSSHAIRNRGTLGGNLCNAHPSSQISAVISALGSFFLCRSEERGERLISADQFFKASLETDLAPDEILCEIIVPVPPVNSAWEFQAMSNLNVDKTSFGVAVGIAANHACIDYARVALCGFGMTPRRLTILESLLLGIPVQAIASEDTKKKFLDQCALDLQSCISEHENSLALSAVIFDTVFKAIKKL